MENSISLGDAFERVALSIRKDLMDVLSLTANNDPEINTMMMSRFCTRTRRKVLQLLAAIRWISTPRTHRIFDALNSYFFNMNDFEYRCMFATSEMHGLHGRVYSMRSPVPLVKDAFGLMKSSKISGLLPSGVFLCGRKQFPPIDPTFLEELNLTIRMKLLNENSRDIFRGSVKACTIHANSCDAQWKLLQYDILASAELRKYLDRRKEHVTEFLNLMKDCSVSSLKEIISKCYHNAMLSRLMDISDKFAENRKGLQPVQVIQSLRVGSSINIAVFGFWKSDFSREYQYHYIAALENPSENSDSKLKFYVKTVQSEKYAVDYFTAKLKEIACVAPNSEALSDLFIRGVSLSEISKEFILLVVDLKLSYLLKRLPTFPASMNVRFELNGQSLIMSSGMFSVVLQLDSITGRFYFNVTSSEKEPLHGNLERFLLEINSVEVERDFAAFYVSHVSSSTDSFVFRPLTTVDLVVAYLKTMDLDATLISTHCQAVSSQEDRSLQFQYLLQNLFAKFWRRKYWICEQSLSAAGDDDHDTATVSTGLGTHSSMKGHQHRLRKKAGKIVLMSYYGYLIRSDFTVVLVVTMRKVYLDKKRPVVLDVEPVESIDKELQLESSHWSKNITASDIAIHTWEALEAQLWTKLQEQQRIRSVLVPVAVGLPLQQVACPLALQTVFDDVSRVYQSKNVRLWPLRSEGKELTIAIAGATTGSVEITFSSASTTAQLLQTTSSSSSHPDSGRIQDLLKTQTGIYAPSKVFATVSLQVCQEQLFEPVTASPSHAATKYQYHLTHVSLYHQYIDSDESIRMRKHRQVEQYVHKVLHMLLQHYSVPVTEIDGQWRLDHLRPMALTMRAIILLFSVCLMDLAQVKAHWSFAKHALQLLHVHVGDDSLTIAFRWNKAPDTDHQPTSEQEEGGTTQTQQTKKETTKKSEQVLGYMSASLQLPVHRQEMPSLSFVDLRHQRTLDLHVEDVSLVNVADFFNMDRFDDN